ncbi:hypothetical protein DYBT9275_05308 [Dyadobacter sp. CECT 9275]|uniref:NUMOD4 domain-containing protein n=1 Tax=Dyadobacter helix TaxID=2822344 RepID=A0A916JI66_9BACT|nr:NUMOD4 domain-containing protein [Dyadobacter sp. CECT 9275]CAG5012989.1 hypothetical protein DYBT9275_05308 [Dyadobacter sp. CECT 9275]
MEKIETKPYRDENLKDRPGEIWKDIPGLEGYFMVSNHGRVKRLERVSFDQLGRKFTTAAKIKLPAINKSENKIKGDFRYRFQIQAKIDAVYYSFQVQRMVYYCFVEPFDLSDAKIVITSEQDNGLDIRPQFLRKTNWYEQTRRTYELGRQKATYEYDPSYRHASTSASKAVTSKKISCYDTSGKRIDTYDSISEAARTTGFSNSRLAIAAKKPYILVDGKFWRNGDSPSTTLSQRPTRDYKESRGMRITQFDKHGNPLAQFLAVSEAARVSNESHSSILSHARLGTISKSGFRWKLGLHTGKLDIPGKQDQDYEQG